MKTTCQQFQKQMFRIRKHLILFIIGYSLLPVYSYGQYTILTPNQNSNLILYNPAFAGTKKCPHAGINYNYQDYLKSGISDYSAEFDSYVHFLEGGVGIILNKSYSESIKNLSAELMYSYSFIISRNTKLITAAKLTGSQSDINFTSLHDRYLYNNYNSITIPQKTQRNLFSVGFGTLLFKKNHYVGFSLENLNRPVESKINGKKSRLPVKYNAIGCVAIRTRIGYFYPVITYQGQGNRFYNDTLNRFLVKDIQHLAFNINYNRNHLYSGIGYTYIFNRTPIYNIQIGYGTEKIQINYNLGYSTYKEEEINKSGNVLFHQISAELTFPCRQKKLKFRTISCPSFGGGGYYGSHRSSSSSGSSSYSYNNSSNIYKNVNLTTKEDEQIKPGTLTAGEINDFKKWDLWIDIAKDELAMYQKTWKITPDKRYSVQVINELNKPATDIQVSLYSQNNELIWKARTDNTGKAELWADLLEKDNKATYIEIENNGTTYTFNEIKEFHDGMNIFKIAEKCSIPDILDIAFVVDATGSMGDEIEYLKTEMNDVMKYVMEKQNNISLRLASVFYRDQGDEYVTRKSDFSKDVSQTINFVKKQDANGGGDFEEAVDKALMVAVNELEWSKDACARILFLVLDAPPHNSSDVKKNLKKVISVAAEKGIRIIPVTGSGIDKSTEFIMRSLSLATNGTYVFLTDHSGVGNKHTDPTTDAYDVEYMNKLILRIIHQFSYIPACDEQSTFMDEKVSDTTHVEIIEHVVLDSSKTRLNKPTNTGIIQNYINASQTVTTEPENTGKSKDSTNTENKYIEIRKSFKFYPNPTNGIVNIEIEGDVKDIYLADINGKLLEHFNLTGQDHLTIDISKYLDGMYFLQYQCNNKWFSGKLLLQKN